MAYESIPTILTAEELMDKAYGRASKVERPDRDRGHRHRKTVLAQVEMIRNIVDDTLGKYVSRFPSLDQIAPYHKELIRLLIGEGVYRQNVGAVDRARFNAVGLLNRALQRLGRETDVEVLGREKRRIYGRLSSILRDIDPNLKKMADMRLTLKRFPGVAPDLFTVVIAGYPNVGKSSLIRALTRAEPEVASYPFTTKAANVGHLEIHRSGVRFSQSHIKIQLIDTPGLLDRPQDERNAIEHQASLAIKHLADLVLFLRDPTGHCGYPVDMQERLLHEVEALVGDVPVRVVETKADFVRDGDIEKAAALMASGAPEDITPPVLRVSVISNEGIAELTDLLVATVTERPKDPELEAFLRGDDVMRYRQ